MNTCHIISKSLHIILAVVLLLPLGVAVRAQDGSGFQETFDDPTLPGWEFTPGVSVVDGVLRVESDGFAFRSGQWSDMTLTLRTRRTGAGFLTIRYSASDTGAYNFGFGDKGAALLRAESGVGTELANMPVQIPADQWAQVNITVSGGVHTISLDGQTVLTAADPQPLPPGGLTLQAGGSATGEFDDLTINAVSGEVLPPETGPTEVAPQTTEGLASQAGSWVRTGGPSGGLGYDIRYNFADPNIWYVTDNYAGVHVSTDNGYTWQPANTGIPSQLGPTGDWRPIFSLTVDPLTPQIIWAGTDMTGHIYKSTDGGLTWQQKDQGVINEWDMLTFRGFTVDPRSSDTVYAMGESSDAKFGGHGVWSQGDGGVIYKTTDGGETWTKIWDGGIPSSLTRYMWINPNNPDVMYVSTGIFDRGAVGEAVDFNTDPDPWGGLGILKSTDGGQTWRVLGKDNGLEGLYVGSLYMHPQNPDILLAAVGHEVGSAQAERFRQEGHSPSGVYRTTDGGETWIHVYEPPIERTGEEFSAVEFCVSDPNIAYAGSAKAIYRSTDAGVTWTQMTPGVIWGPPGVRAGWPIDLQCDPRDPNRLFANNYQGGAFLSEDGGSTWVNASQGYTGAQMYHIVVDPHDSARVYVSGRSGGWRSDDGGATWVGLRNLTEGEPQPLLAEWGTIALNPANPDQIWSADGDGPIIIVSQDRGASWTMQVSPEGVQGTVLTYAFTLADPNTIYAGYGDPGCLHNDGPCPLLGGISVSHDGGQTWTLAASEPLLATTIAELAADPANAQVVYAATTEAGLFKTTDGGVSWDQLNLSTVANPATNPKRLLASPRVQAVALDPGNPQHIVIGVYLLGIFTSHDGGITWQSAYAGLEPNGSIHDIIFDPTNPLIVYAADRVSGAYRSTDGGQTWTKINDGLENRAATGLAISADGQRLYLATDGQGVYRLDLNGTSAQ